MKTLGTPLDPELIHELKALARSGAETKTLAAHIRTTFDLQGDMHVPILAYFGRAFQVSLRVLLPLREEGFHGSYARMLQVAFWLSIGVQDRFDCIPWNWDEFREMVPNGLAADNLTKWQQTDASTLEYLLLPNARGLFGKACFCERIDKLAELAFADFQPRIDRFSLDFSRMMQDQFSQAVDATEKQTASLCFDFEINDEGPVYKVVCVVRAIKEISKQARLSAMQPIG